MSVSTSISQDSEMSDALQSTETIDPMQSQATSDPLQLTETIDPMQSQATIDPLQSTDNHQKDENKSVDRTEETNEETSSAKPDPSNLSSEQHILSNTDTSLAQMDKSHDPVSQSHDQDVTGEGTVDQDNSEQVLINKHSSSHESNPTGSLTVGIDSSSPLNQEISNSDSTKDCPPPSDSHSDSSDLKLEDVTIRERTSPNDNKKNKPKVHPLSIDTSDSEIDVTPPYSPGLYTSGESSRGCMGRRLNQTTSLQNENLHMAYILHITVLTSYTQILRNNIMLA